MINLELSRFEAKLLIEAVQTRRLVCRAKAADGGVGQHFGRQWRAEANRLGVMAQRIEEARSDELQQPPMQSSGR